jgi:ABC-type amino acid transport system permease subunit
MTASPNRLRASIVDLTFIIWACVVPLLFGNRLFNGDGDFARHLRMGEFVLAGGPYQTDGFAHTFSGPFLTTEWLSQVTFALANRVGGLPAAAVLAGLLIGAAYALIVQFMRRQGVDPLLAYATGVVAAILGAPHWVARPHIFTFIGLALLLHLAAGPGARRTDASGPSARRSDGRTRLVWYALLFAVWANFHGGFVLGIMVLLALAAGDLAEARLASDSAVRGQWIGRARDHGIAALVGVAACMANPIGPMLPARVIGILRNDYLLSRTVEFQSPDFHMLYGRILLVVILAVIATLALRRERPSLPRLAVMLMLLAGALYARRNIPLFGIVALPLLALELDAAFRGLTTAWLARVRATFDAGERIAVRWRWAPWFTVALIVLGATGGRIAGTRIVRAEFDERTFPVAAVAAAREAGLQGNMLNLFTWGGYIIWAWPEQRVYIDGMTDFLGNAVLESYSKVLWLEPGWETELDAHDVTLAIMPAGSRVVHALSSKPGWLTWYEDDVATILTLGEPVTVTR